VSLEIALEWEHLAREPDDFYLPHAFMDIRANDFLILRAVRASGGTCLAVSDDESLDWGVELATDEGLFIAPEGAACVAACKKLLETGFLKSSEKIVIYNTGAGLKYLEAFSTRFPRTAGSTDSLISPR